MILPKKVGGGGMEGLVGGNGLPRTLTITGELDQYRFVHIFCSIEALHIYLSKN